MGNEKTNTVGDRKILKVSIFLDEYKQFGIESKTLYNEAVTSVRAKLGLPERFKVGSEKTAVGRLSKNATPEALAKAKAILEEGQAEAPAEAEEETKEE